MYRDEVLTMSARMAAATGDLKWVTRYEDFGPRSNPATKDFLSVLSDDAVNAGAVLTTLADDKLAAIESEALDLVRQGDVKAAAALLRGSQYQQQKFAYQEGVMEFADTLCGVLETRLDKHWRRAMGAFTAISVILLLMISVWLFARQVRKRLHERARTEEKLSAFAQEWRGTFNAITDSVCIVDRNGGKILQCNKAMTWFLDKPYDEIIGGSCCELIHGSDEPVKKCPLTRMWKTGRSQTQVLQRGEKWLNIKVDPIINNKGDLIGAVHIISDITERKRAFQEIEDLAKFPSEDPNPVVRISQDCRILYANDASAPVLKTWGANEGQCLPEPMRKKIEEVWDSRDGSAFELTCHDGRIFFIKLQPIVGQGYVNGYGFDITKRKKAEKEKIDLELQLSQKQKMEAIGTLAGGIAHDFNNILAAMQGYVELSLEDIEDIPEGAAVRENLENVLSCGKRATKLVRQVLTFSRKNQQEKEVTEIGSIVKEVLKMLRASLPATIKIFRKIEADSSMVLADPTQIHQVLVNLCTNASHAMRETGGMLQVGLTDITLESETRIGDERLGPGQYAKLTVSDSGCGMDKEVIERIFEPFFTTKQVNEGTGLGLSVVHGIIRSHHGAIEVESAPGEGTTFCIFLPKVEATEVQESESPVPAAREHEVILLVDDERMMVDVTKLMLERLGYTVIAKTSSVDALETFQEKPDEFDLVITDQIMPNLTGTQLATELMAIRPDIPVILCTGFGENVSPEEAESMGIRKFVMKPISKDEIEAIVRNVLGASETTDSREAIRTCAEQDHQDRDSRP
ncbi:MAG: response regulator [Phycisphaerales bacterium]|nr:MAG: response regulator [Phycisphaerales bacterium]